MVKFQEYGEEVGDIKFFKNCGTKIEAPNEENVNTQPKQFCHYCGKKLIHMFNSTHIANMDIKL